MSQQNPSIFAFQSIPIRTNVRNGQIWFVARDVCAALGICWTGTALAGIQADWQGLWSDHNLNTNQSLKFISEPAVYKLAFRSNKPQADAFTNWVASEVLPSIRKTGKYEAKPRQKALPPVVSPLQRDLEDLYYAFDKKQREIMAWAYDVDKELGRLTGPLYHDVCDALPAALRCDDSGIECLHHARWAGLERLKECLGDTRAAIRYAMFFARAVQPRV